MAKHYSATRHIYNLNDDVLSDSLRKSVARAKELGVSLERTRSRWTLRMCKKIIRSTSCISQVEQEERIAAEESGIVAAEESVIV